MHPFDEPVDLVGLATCLPHLGYNHIAVNFCIDFGVSFDANQAVLFGMVEPVTSLTGDNESLDLVCFDPHELIDFLITPLIHALSSEFHRPAGHPQEYNAVILQQIHP